MNRKKYLRDYRLKNKKRLNKVRREYRHRKGISKKFISKYGGIIKSKNPEILRQYRKRYKALSRKAGKLTKEIIEKVYQNNIKKFGLLTCIYCLKSIKTGQDSLEHKIPLSRGGNHNIRNLGIACIRCNKRKHNKTIKEFKKGETKNG